MQTAGLPETAWAGHLSGRNLTDEKRTYLIGKAYSHRKNRHGGDRKSEEVKSRAQNEHLKTSELIAQEHGVSRATVERAETYAKAVDSIAENLGEEVKQKILSGEIKANKQDIVKLSKVEPAKQAEIVERVSIGEEKDVKSATNAITLQDAKEEIIQAASLNPVHLSLIGIFERLQKAVMELLFLGECILVEPDQSGSPST